MRTVMARRRTMARDDSIPSAWGIDLAPAGDDRPDRRESVTADGVNPVVEIDGRVAVRDVELEAVSQLRERNPRRRRELSELVARESVGPAGLLLGPGRSARVGRERLDPGVHRDA